MFATAKVLFSVVICCVLGPDLVGSTECGRKDKIQMTVMSIKPRNSESISQPLPHYECYLGAGDEDAAVTAVRAYRTRNYAEPEPTSVDRITGLPPNTVAHNVTLETSNNGAFGVFNCTAVKEGKQNTTIMTIFMRYDSYTLPADGLFTRTVDIGDKGVIINMNYTTGIEDVRWRINGSLTIPRKPDEKVAYVSEDFNRILVVSDADNGLYEGHRFMQRNASHAMQRLLVRGCLSGKWGPPGCTGICDYCYNGGVCDDETGRCVCAPGFKGTNCLTGCGGNRYGYFCEFQCDAGGSEDDCRGRQFCLLDPFGCRCNAGFKGLNCNTPCEDGKFGAGCLQECHCQFGRPCNRFTGVCGTGGCMNGWNGDNCQVPDECPDSYYGADCTSKCLCENDGTCNKTTGQCLGNSNCSDGSMLDADNKCKACIDGYYGNSCSEVCRCASDACDKVTGECVGCCKHQWIDKPIQRCQEGIYSASFTKVNPGQATTVTCTTEVLDGNDIDIFLVTSPDQVSWSERGGVPSNIPVSGRPGFQRHTAEIPVNNAQPEDEYYCQLRDGETILAWLNTSFSTYELPVLSDGPSLLNRSQTSITIRWRAWDNVSDVGDPPIVKYIPYFKITSNGELMPKSPVSATAALQYTIPDLMTDTNYTFSILAVRDGQGGEGPMGPEITIKTLCDAPSAPTDITAEITVMQQLNISWKVPVDNMCSTGITGYTIYYYIDGAPGDVEMIEIDVTTRTWSIVRDLTPGTSYIFTVSLTTDQKSGRSGRTDPVTFPIPLPMPTNAGTLLPVIVAVLVVVLLVIIVLAAVIFIRKKGKTSTKPRLDEPSYINQGMTDAAPNSPSTYEEADSSNPKKPANGTHYEVSCAGSLPSAQPTVGSHYESTGQGLPTPPTTAVSTANRTPYEVTGQVQPPPAQPPVATNSRRAGKGSPPPKKAVEEFDADDEGRILPDSPLVESVYANVPRPIPVSQLPAYYRDNQCGNLEQEFHLLKKNKQHPWSVAEKIQNQKKNRFRQLYAYDHSRVVLDPLEGDEHSDYYNSCFISDHEGKKAFIASQAPNSACINDFWRMIWQEEVSTIVMLSNLIESGKDRCTQYWPDEQGRSKNFGTIVVSWASTTPFADFDVRILQVSLGSEFRTVLQLHYTTWPDMDVPRDPAPLMELIQHTKIVQGSNEGPVLVHCSAGIGRTGTFIALYCLMEVLKEEKKISIFDFVQNARENRINMVQKKEQYTFIYQCLVDHYLTRHTEIPSGLLAQLNIDSKLNTLAEEFKLLSSLKNNSISTMQDGQDHSEKNRFPQTEPTDKGRVYLSSQASTGFSNYINATLFRSLKKTAAYITTQAPLPDTVEDFWRLVYDWNCSIIVMLNQLDRKDKTCVSYWPEEGSAKYGHMSVSFTDRKKHPTHIHRQFEVAHAKQQKRISVTQFQLLSWSNGPTFPGLKELQKSIILTHSPPGPMLVHCIDGIGRSSIFAAAQSVLAQRELSGTVDVFNTVRQMRQRNRNVIKTQDDYTLCYRILRDLIQTDGSYENMPDFSALGRR